MAAHHPSWIKPLRISGLILFIFSMIAFTSLMFLGNYQLTEKTVDEKITDLIKLSYFKEASGHVIDKNFANVFSFMNEVDLVFSEANLKFYEDCKLTDEDVKAVVKNSKKGSMYVFTSSKLDSIFDDSVDGEFKKKSFRDYNSWLEGREFLSEQDLFNHINNSAMSVNESLIANKGFDDGKIKNFKYEFALAANQGTTFASNGSWFFLIFGLGVIGALLYILPILKEGPEGIKNNKIFQSSATNVGLIGIFSGSWLILFYIYLYMFPEYITNWVLLVDPLSYMLNGGPASQWFLYGFLYTIAILVMGIRMIIKYRHNKYQIFRTLSVMFFQSSFAFILIQFFQAAKLPAYDLKNIWPLDYSFFFDYRLNSLAEQGVLGYWMLGWGLALFLIGVPLFTYFYGKRWYCSWVCGCGGLAETLGDPYRQLSDKSLKAWKVERILIHAVLLFAIVMTGAVLYTYFTNQYELLGVSTYKVQSAYSLLIGSVFSGIIGTGFYPLMGNRVWCRFGCPLAAYLGLVQRFKSRFRITTNGSQCISCGNCSTYCEMGIDVRWYAQREQDIVRSSCVGCGICAAVCPRGVLKLENGTVNIDQHYIETEELVKH